MRSLILASLAGVLSFAAAAHAQDAAPQPAPEPVKEKKICQSEVALGSTLPKRICRTKAEWRRLEVLNQREMDRTGGLDRARSGTLAPAGS